LPPSKALTAFPLLVGKDGKVVSQGLGVSELSTELAKQRVTGAPVVDATGRCVGVISSSDVVHWAEQGGHATKSAARSQPILANGR